MLQDQYKNLFDINENYLKENIKRIFYWFLKFMSMSL